MAVSRSSKSVPAWVYVSIATNIILGITLGLGLLGDRYFTDPMHPSDEGNAPKPSKAAIAQSVPPPPFAGHSLTYQDWVALLRKEAASVAKAKPDRLMILVGDSLTLWFPQSMLPSDRTWLNQGISGENALGLSKRLGLFEKTQPQAIFVMVGINDLLKGNSDQDVLDNYDRIIETLKKAHPKSKIVMQSILPHAKENITVVNFQQVMALSNDRIAQLNRRLAVIADQKDVSFLDLQPLFSDNEGFLRSELTSDGLHLSRQGYLVWRSAIETFNQLTFPAH